MARFLPTLLLHSLSHEGVVTELRLVSTLFIKFTALSSAAVGADAVTIGGASVVVDPDERLADLATKDGTVLKKRVLSDAGEDLGSVHDIDLDPESGALLELIVGEKKHRTSVAGSRLLGVGSYAVVVKAE